MKDRLPLSPSCQDRLFRSKAGQANTSGPHFCPSPETKQAPQASEIWVHGTHTPYVVHFLMLALLGLLINAVISACACCCPGVPIHSCRLSSYPSAPPAVERTCPCRPPTSASQARSCTDVNQAPQLSRWQSPSQLWFSKLAEQWNHAGCF